jgi:hypothetical protein
MGSEDVIALSAAGCHYRKASHASCATGMNAANQPGRPDLSEPDMNIPRLRRLICESFWNDGTGFSNPGNTYEVLSYQWGTATKLSQSKAASLDHARSSDNDMLTTCCPPGLPDDVLLELPPCDINRSLWGWVDGPANGAEDLTTEMSLGQREVNPWAVAAAIISDTFASISLKTLRDEMASFKSRIDEFQVATATNDLEPAATGRSRSSRVTLSSCKHPIGFGRSRRAMHLDNGKHSTSTDRLCAWSGRHERCESCLVEKEMGSEIRQAWELSIASVNLDCWQCGRRSGSAQAAKDSDAGTLPSETSDGRKEGDAGPARVSDPQTILTWATRLIEGTYSWVRCSSEKESSWFPEGLLLSHV